MCFPSPVVAQTRPLLSQPRRLPVCLSACLSCYTTCGALLVSLSSNHTCFAAIPRVNNFWTEHRTDKVLTLSVNLKGRSTNQRRKSKIVAASSVVLCLCRPVSRQTRSPLLLKLWKEGEKGLSKIRSVVEVQWNPWR